MKDVAKKASLLAPTALVLFTACAEPPSNTDPLTDEQRKQVEEIMEEMEIVTPVVEGILEKADPLCDLEGNPTEDNEELQEGIFKIMTEVQDIWDADRIVTRPLGEFSQGEHVLATAHGTWTDSSVDNYIVLGVEEDGWLPVDVDALMHEGAHYFYGMHNKEVRETAKEAATLSDPDHAELLEQYIEQGDVPYIISELYISSLHFLFYLERASERDTEWLRKLVETGNYTGEHEAAQNNRDNTYQQLLELSTKEGWARKIVDDGLWEVSQERFDVLGITHDEFLEVVMEQDELFQEHKEIIDETLEAWYEFFPEYQEEVQSEHEMEMELSRASRR